VLGELPADADDKAKAEHEAMTKLAARYNSPKEVIKALRAANIKISSGAVKTALPKDANEAQLKEWREENGIPHKPEDYKLELGNGVVLDEDDKGLVAGFLQSMHKQNAPPAIVNAAVKSYLAMREEEVAAMVAANEETVKASRVALTEEWGAKDCQANLDGIKTMLNAAGSDVMTAFQEAAGVDGVKLLAKAPILRWLGQHARETGFVGATLSYGADGGAAMEDRITAIQKIQQEKPNDYYSNPRLQEELSGLLVAKKRHSEKK
jgi:post-segregation antitoxin (ccd killing protein)